MNDLIESFLSGLEQDRSKSGDFSDRINKVYFSFEGNQGIISFAPFIDSVTHRPYISLKGVKEYKTVCTKYKNAEEETWIKILPKQAYGQLSQENSELYDRVSSLWDQINAEVKDDENSYTFIRTKRYSLFQGIITSQQDLTKKSISDNVGKACLLVYPSSAPIDSLAAAIEAKNATLNSKEWLSVIFTPGVDGRQGVVVISFNKKPNNSFGYEANVSFELNNTFNKVVDPSAFDPKEVEKLTDMVGNFLGWQSGDENAFDTTLFTELEGILKLKVKMLDNPAPQQPTPAPENKNGVDPMLAEAAKPAEQSAPQAQAPGQAAAAGGIKYPF